jgi:thymidylate synthase (FAD)
MIKNPELLAYGLKNIEYGARISHRSEEDMKDDTWIRFIQNVVINHGDWSVVEHCYCSVIAVMDRGCTHEWVRHRLNSFTQESTRFVNYEKKMPPSFIYPIVGVECEYCLAGEDFSLNDDREYAFHERKEMVPIKCPYNPAWLSSMEYAEINYKQLLLDKWRPQEARSVFPNALASKIMTTSNLRSWRHLLLMRTTKEAHPQIREICIDLLKQLQQAVPLLFDDIDPNCTQIENMRKPH